MTRFRAFWSAIAAYLFILLSALGLSHSLFGERLFPIGTLYDPFIARGLAFASAIRSLIDFTGSDGLTINMCGPAAA